MYRIVKRAAKNIENNEAFRREAMNHANNAVQFEICRINSGYGAETRARSGKGESWLMKQDEKKKPAWEMVDPKPPVVQSGHLENRKQNQNNEVM